MRFSSLMAAGLLLCLYHALGAQAPREVLTVEQAVAEALGNNPGMRAERVNVGIAGARIVTAGERPNPVLSGGGDHLDLLGARFSEDNGAGPTEMNFRADYTIERGGKRSRRVEVAGAARTVAEWNTKDAVRTLILETQSAFVEAVLARESLAHARENLESLNRIVTINENRLRVGDISRLELTRVQLAALDDRNSVRKAELRLSTALTRLASLLGRENPRSITDVAGDFRRDLDMPALSTLRQTARVQRPDVQALRGDVARAAAEVRLQRAGATQDYTVGTEYRRQQGINGKSNSVGFFFEVPLPVFSRNQGEIERARQEHRQAELRLRARENAVEAEVETAHQEYLAAAGLVREIENNMLRQARDVRDMTEYSYNRGDATLLELLDAQRAFQETTRGYNEARAEYALALYALDAASGKVVTQ